jgi:carbonic anhydrase
MRLRCSSKQTPELWAQSPALLMPALARAMPNVKAIIIGCADMRVNPAHVLGIKPGEAVVLRNIGGRVTPGVVGAIGSARTNR